MALNKNYVDEVTPEQIIKIYTEDGMVITVNQAKAILEFLYLLADIALDRIEGEMQNEKLLKVVTGKLIRLRF